MSAEEAVATPEVTEPATNGDAGPTGTAPNGKKGKDRKDEKPIEELFDLSKPIPRVSPKWSSLL
jgi:hypothetical protein